MNANGHDAAAVVIARAGRGVTAGSRQGATYRVECRCGVKSSPVTSKREAEAKADTHNLHAPAVAVAANPFVLGQRVSTDYLDSPAIGTVCTVGVDRVEIEITEHEFAAPGVILTRRLAAVTALGA